MTSTPSSSGPPTKARKILRRTLSGARLVLGLAFVLWLASLAPYGEPVFAVAALVVALAVWELSRMGACTRLPILLVLGGPFLLLAALHWAELAAVRRAGEEELLPVALGAAWRGELRYEYPLAVLCPVALLALLRTFRGAIGRTLALFGLAALLFAAWRIVAVPLEARVTGLLVLLIAIAVALGGLPRLLRRSEARAETAAVFGLALWLLPPLFLLWGLWREFGNPGLVAILLLSKIGDTAGYYFGSWLGRSHPFPKISPGKTTAGCVASFCAATLLGLVCVATGLLPEGRLGLAGGLVAGAALNLAAQAGDLLESWIKRRAEVKDSSTWFGPSGGLLDQIDSLLLSVPTAVLVFALVFDR